MAKTENKRANRESQKEFAYALFMNNTTQGDIAEKVGVSRQTVGKWIAESGWSERRAAQSISRTELANRMLKGISDLIDQINANNKEDAEVSASSIDKLTKMASIVEKLDKRAGVVETIEVFIAFGKWLEYQRTTDATLTAELVKTINEYQNKYINDLMAVKLNS